MESQQRIDRRQWQRVCLAGTAAAAAPWFSPLDALGQERPGLQPLNRFSRMVQEYFVDQLRQVEAAGAAADEAEADADVAPFFVAGAAFCARAGPMAMVESKIPATSGFFRFIPTPR